VAVHGDDASALKHERNVHGISWSSVASHRTIWQNRFLIAALETASLTPDAKDSLWRFIQWSFQSLYSGCWFGVSVGARKPLAQRRKQVTRILF
jgi:hypothetical protein